MINFYYALGYLSIYSALCPIVALLFSRTRQAWLLAIVILSLISFIFDITNRMMVADGYRGYEMLNIFFFIQFLLLTYVFTQLVADNKLIYYVLVLFTGIAIYNILKIQSLNEYQSVTQGVGCLIMLGYCSLYYMQLMQMVPTFKLSEFAPFWVTLAVFIYFGFNLIVFFIANDIFYEMPTEAGMVFWASHNVSNIIKNILFSIAIYWGGNLPLRRGRRIV